MLQRIITYTGHSNTGPKVEIHRFGYFGLNTANNVMDHVVTHQLTNFIELTIGPA